MSSLADTIEPACKYRRLIFFFRCVDEKCTSRNFFLYNSFKMRKKNICVAENDQFHNNIDGQQGFSSKWENVNYLLW
jgi:hypothetical protein